MSDPLGLTPDQRMRSNMFAVFRRRETWWPPDVEEAIERPEPTACGYCRAISGHAPTCIGQLAETLHDIQARIDVTATDQTPGSAWVCGPECPEEA